jgi:Ca2+-binding RTX toxin-like protein
MGPWPARIIGPANWSQDLTLSVTATSRELATGHTRTTAPVPVNIEINARPTDIVGNQVLEFNENTAAGTSLALLSALDADAADTATFSLLDNAGGRFTLTAGGQLAAGSTRLDREAAASHTIRVQVTDSGGLTHVRDLVVAVRDVNEAPTVVAQSRAALEDTVLSGSVGAADPESGVLSYSISGTPSRGTLNLNPTTGAWTYTPTANLYGIDSFVIRVTDAGGLSALQGVTVNVASVNDAPSAIALSGAPSGIAENDRPISGTVAAAVVLGTLSATDVDAPDAGDFATHVYSVTDSRFEIVNGNVLRLRAGAVLDFETTPTISLDVTVKDRNGAGLAFTRSFTFTVLNRDDYFYGTSTGEAITGTAGVNRIFGAGGNDTLTGAGNNDVIEGGDGADQLFGLAGADSLAGGLGNDILDGGADADTLAAGEGDDTLRGQDGDDVLTGEAGLDLLQGGAGADQLNGGADNDQLDGGIGNDRLVGGDGDDTLTGGAGADQFLGGEGFDTVTYASATTAITVNVMTTFGSAGDAAGDLFEDAPERLIGSAYGDTITGSSDAETIEGGAGNDTIYGGAGHDTLIGGEGNDYLDAQSGNDTLDGGGGDDVLIGGDDSDTYLMTLASGADEIRNFDPNGTDIDVVGYQGITHNQLWFERSGDSLVVSVVGTSVRTTIRDWYVVTDPADRSNYKIDFFLASGHVSQNVDVEMLVALMGWFPPPTTQAEFDTIHAISIFAMGWNNAWRLNAPPSIPEITAQTLNEDGTLTLTLRITDDFTPASGLTVSARAVRTDNHLAEDLRVVNAPTISAPDGSGNRTLTMSTRPNASGQVAIHVQAVDAGGVGSERIFLLTVNAVADTPVLTVVQAATPTAPLTRPTLDSGFWSLNIQAALTDQDGSETLEVRISGVPSGITFNAGVNLGSGVWSFTPAQLSGLRVQGPASWSQDLALSVVAISRESTGATATSAAVPLNIVINARPTDLAAGSLSFTENAPAGAALTALTRTDADAGDTATYALLNDAGGRFTIDSNGTLRAGSTAMNFESATTHSITVRVTDSGGLTYDETFAVNVLNLNEAPTALALSAAQIYEDEFAGAVIGTLSSSDVDVGDTATYSLVSNPGSLFQIQGNTLRTTAPLNYEASSSYTVRVRVTDAGGLTYERDFSVGVLNRNEAPSDITLSGSFVYENDPAGTIIGTLGRSDVDAGDTATYSLVSNPGNLFQIQGNTLTTVAPLNYEGASSFTVRVRVADAAGATYDKDFVINVGNRNEAPIDIQATLQPIGENSGAGTVVGQFTAIDPDTGDALTFTMLPSSGLPGFESGTPGEFFHINANGQIVTTNRALDYEAAPIDGSGFRRYQVRVQATDSVGNYRIETFDVRIGNVNEAPRFANPTLTLGISEDGYVNGVAAATDPENNISGYSLYLGASRGSVSVNSAGAWSYTPQANWSGSDSFVIRAVDAGGLAGYQTINVNVTPVNDAPTITTSSFSVYEQNVTQVGQAMQLTSGLYAVLTGSDLEGSALRYQVIDQQYRRRSDGAWIQENIFAANASNQLVLTGGTVDYDQAAEHRVLVRAWDGGSVGAGAYSDKWINVNVANAAPQLAGFVGPSQVGGSNAWSYAGRINGWDHGGGAVTYEVVSSFYYEIYENDFDYSFVHEETWLAGAPVTVDSNGNVHVQFKYEFNSYSTIWGPKYELRYGTEVFLNVRVRDSSGSTSGTIGVRISINGGTPAVGAPWAPTYYTPPVVLDLDGDGIELVSLSESSVSFRVKADAAPTVTGWAGADDAFLALDRDGDGVITNGTEISFIDDLPGAVSDLEGLAAFDTDADGSLDAGDARFEEFLVWQDRNQDGVSQAEELSSLSQREIESIRLARSLTGHTVEGATDNVITATSEYVRADGTTGDVGDVSLASVGYVEDDAGLEATYGSQPRPSTPIEEIDRRSDNQTPVVPDPFSAQPVDAIEAQARDSNASMPRQSSPEGNEPPVVPEQSQLPQLAAISPDMQDQEVGEALPVRGALHASLDSVARRRLLMIDAMASFSAESSSMLELQPQRRVDARTLELLTTVAGVRSVA